MPTPYDSTDDPAVTQVMLVGTVGNGLYRSIDSGQTYTPMSNSRAGLPGGSVTDIVADPNDDDVCYAGVVGSGVYRSDDGGDAQAADAGGGNSYRYSATQPGTADPNQSPIQRHEFSDATTEVGAPLSRFPAAGLPGLTNRVIQLRLCG